MRSVNIISRRDYLTAQMLPLVASLHKWDGSSFSILFFDDAILSAEFHTTDLIIKQYSSNVYGQGTKALGKVFTVLLRSCSQIKTHVVIGEERNMCFNIILL